ncbi:E3 ubiquitin-protein ligase RING1-like [Bienertia sinuspersici]
MENLKLSTLSSEGVNVTSYAFQQLGSLYNSNSQVDDLFTVMLWYKHRNDPIGKYFMFTLEKESDIREQLLLRGVTIALDTIHADVRVYYCVIDVVSESCDILLGQVSEIGRKSLKMIVKIEVDFGVYEDGVAYPEIDTDVHEEAEEEEVSGDEVKSFLSSNSGVRFISGDQVGGDIECCSICLEEFEKPKNNSGDNELDDVAILPCSHIFHGDCLVSCFVRGKNTCPMCRYNFSIY